MTRTPVILASAVLAMVLGLWSCAHAQQGSWRRPDNSAATTTPPDEWLRGPAGNEYECVADYEAHKWRCTQAVKVCTEERITTMAQARAADKAVCK
jgi:hypothetical protein